VRNLRLISLLLLNKSKLCPTIWYKSLEDLTEVLVKSHEVFLKCLLLLLVHVNQQLHDALFSRNLLSKLLHQLLILGGVLFIPLDTVPVLSWHLIELHGFFLYLTSELLNCLVLP